jgi:Icc-related predicted phosphoesterase
VSALRVAASGDLHVDGHRAGALREAFAPLDDQADLLLLAGDLTQNGTRGQARALVEALAELSLPIVAVLGNHDFDANEEDDVRRILERAEVRVLEGSNVRLSIAGCSVGIAGTTGFGGGFANARAADFGEPEMKAFAARTRGMAERLCAALAALDSDVNIALLHYAPVAETLMGERRELYPFLGCEELGRAIDAAGADLALHGHAHFGCESGVTPGGVAVRNVAQPVLGAPYRVFEFREDK